MASTEPESNSETFFKRLDSDDESDENNDTKSDSGDKNESESHKSQVDDDDLEDGPKKQETKKISDDEDEEDQKDSDSDKGGSGGRIRKMISDDEEEDYDTKKVVDNKQPKGKKKKVRDSDDESESESESSSEDDDEDDDNEDEDDDEDNDDNGKVKKKTVKDKATNHDDADNDDDDDDDDGRGGQSSQKANDVIYDFDIMMAKKKEENSRKRRRRGYDIINDNDDIIADIINQMKDAVEADIEANRNKQVATNKLKLLPFLINQLRKVDLRDAFLDSDVLSVMTEWLAPLPDRSLPHLNIRENLLKILIDFNLYDVDRIKSSGIGKAVMYLYKHPRETKENKQRAKQLISAWSRPIFNLDSSFSAISREEREERDKELKRRASRSIDSSDGEGSSQTPKRAKEADPQPAKNPGDKGWIPRARVPAPSMRDYVIRPRSKVDGDIGKASKRPANILEKLMKTHQERRRANKQQRAINMKIDKL